MARQKPSKAEQLAAQAELANLLQTRESAHGVVDELNHKNAFGHPDYFSIRIWQIDFETGRPSREGQVLASVLETALRKARPERSLCEDDDLMRKGENFKIFGAMNESHRDFCVRASMLEALKQGFQQER